MLKGVKKGIKKKIKGKKDKHKEDDLFDPEQLEKYKKELEEAKKARQQQDEESGSGNAAGSSGGAGHEEDEEWLRFKQLTSGVDVLVNKVSTDLDRIKESSFFQRNKPSEQNKIWAGPRPPGAILPSPEREKAKFAAAEEEHHENEAENEVPAEEEEAAGEDTVDDGIFKVPDSPDVVPIDLDDSLFDTGFVDAIATGDIKLAYIPDSPTYEDEDDPFSTEVYDKVVKKIEEDEKKAKRQVNLGTAVDFLTGKVEKTGIERPRMKAAETKAKARPRPHAINLLGDFDDASMPSAPPPDYSKGKANGKVDRPTDLFDQILGSPIKDTASPLLEKVDLLPGKAIEVRKKDASPKEEKGIKDVISEFDIISQLDPIETEPLPAGLPSSIPSSIAALLTTSTEPAAPEEDEWDDEFAALAAEAVHKGQPPPSEEPEEAAEEEEDPFNTSYVDKIAVHGKCELKILEDEFLGEVKSSESKNENAGDDDDDFDFNPRLGESPPKNLQIQNPPKANLLEDLSPITVRAPAIQPQVKAAGPTLVDTVEGGEEKGGAPGVYSDPFDTSSLETVLPGKTELKLLEAELLSAVEPKVELPKLPEKIVTAIIKKQQTEDDFDFDPRKDEVIHHVLDTHDAEHHAFDTVSHVLTPQLEIERETDAFDTSFVAGLIPGALELKLLEDELVSPTKEAHPPVSITTTAASSATIMTRTFSEDDFDPRGGIPAPTIVNKPPPTTEDIFDSTMDFAVDKPLTPQLEMPSQAIPEPKLCPTNVEDPFDTSGIQIENYLAKSELKQMEEELLNTPPQPLRTLPVVVAVEYKKPPQQVAPPQPPPPQLPVVPHPLEAMTPIEDSIKPLTPLEIPAAMSGVISVFNPSPMADPFNTSFADGLIPGKTEIKLLEEELGVGAGMSRRLSDDDFNPRQPSHPSNQMTSQPLTPMPIQPQTKPV